MNVQTALQPTAGIDPAAVQIAAAVQQARASLGMLAQHVGKSFVGTVQAAPELPHGFQQISTTLAHTIVRLEQPIPVGSVVEMRVSPGSSPGSPPVVTVTLLPATQQISSPSPAQMLPSQLVHLQQSPGPLYESLNRQLAQLPPAVAQAGAQLLAHRLPLDRTQPSATALKSAILQSGVLLDSPTSKANSPDIRTALTQLRSALLDWMGGSVAPVVPVGRRPPPPMRGAPPRAPELPPADSDAPPQQLARHLLAQTEGALARLKLMQLTSEGNDQRLGTTTAAAEWNLEIPLLVGRELSMAQIQVGRDARDQEAQRRPSWRLRFAMRLSAIGEVGAHIGLSGGRASVALWAEEPATAAVLTELLPELSRGLAARGLEVGAITVKAGAPQSSSTAPGHLMDAAK